MLRLVLESRLSASAESVWEHARSFSGINQELWPLHMTSPQGLRLSADLPAEQVLFRSVLTLLRLLPLDIHAFALTQVWNGRGFRERSTSLMQRSWIHERIIEAHPGGGSLVRDTLEFEPRLLPSITGLIVRVVFKRRHRRLRQKFAREK